MIEQATKALIDVGIDHVEEVGGTLNVRQGTGPMARSVNVDPTEIVARLESFEGSALTREAASWANGLLTTLLEPKRSDARDWTFVEAAGSILPTIEGASFALGVSDATGGDPAWTQPITDELVRGWVLRLGRGLRPLTDGQVADWGVTEDRITSAGRSLLFHKTRNFRFEPSDRQHVFRLHVGDGHDAARLWVVADAFFTEVDGSWRFTIPHSEAVFAVKEPEHIEALALETHIHFGSAMYPLDRRVWTLGKQGPEAQGAIDQHLNLGSKRGPTRR